MHDLDTREQASRLRGDGYSLVEISQTLGVSTSTVSLWTRGVPLTTSGQARVQARMTGPQKAAIMRAAQHHVRSKRRSKDFERGLASTPSLEDALCVGLYWGEGTKADGSWAFTNSDRGAVAAMIGWAVRSGHPSTNFRAKVQIHPEDFPSDAPVIDYWAEAGIPRENIRVYRARTSSSKRVSKRRMLFGTCQVLAKRGGVALYQYYLGQLQGLASWWPSGEGTGLQNQDYHGFESHPRL